jgi:endonuclease/exonuclease/phosphatase family metal-dependent hydrolase
MDFSAKKISPNALSVVSYNIHKGLAAGNVRMALRRMRDRLHRLAPDIVLVQEIVGHNRQMERRFADWPIGTQLEFLADQMWPHTAYGRNAVYKSGDHGNAILSRYPILHVENIDLSLHAREQRGILHIQIDAPGFERPVHVCCTHLNLLHGHRKRQVAAIAMRIEGAVPANCPLILGGDFNDWRLWATRELESRIGVRETHYSMHGYHARTFPGFSPLLALDRIYVRQLRVLDSRVLDGGGWRMLSDHLGLHTVVAPVAPGQTNKSKPHQ